MRDAANQLGFDKAAVRGNAARLSGSSVSELTARASNAVMRRYDLFAGCEPGNNRRPAYVRQREQNDARGG